MAKNQIDKLMNILLGLAAFAVLLGAMFKLQHYPNGNQILNIGFIASFALIGIEIYRLKKIINQLKQYK